MQNGNQPNYLKTIIIISFKKITSQNLILQEGIQNKQLNQLRTGQYFNL